MLSELERIQRVRQDQLKQIQTKEDKQQSAANDNLDTLQAKENSYKEEFMKQLKLADHHHRSPSHMSQVMMQHMAGGILSHLDHFA